MAPRRTLRPLAVLTAALSVRCQADTPKTADSPQQVDTAGSGDTSSDPDETDTGCGDSGPPATDTADTGPLLPGTCQTWAGDVNLADVGIYVAGDGTPDGWYVQVTTLANFNGDGAPTVALASAWEDVSGGSVRLLDAMPVTGETFTSLRQVVSPDPSPGDFGMGLEAAGDVDGDGLSDLIVGAPGDGTNGAVYLLYGPDPQPTLLVEGAPDGENAGYFVGSAGDIDNDGYDDVWEQGVFGEGPFDVRVYAGGPCRTPPGLEGAAVVVTEGSPEYVARGLTDVLSVDADGDGERDLVIGGQNAQMTVYAGPLHGTYDPSEAWARYSDWSWDYAGTTLALVDFEGDGLPTLVVAEGAAYYYGSAVYAVAFPIPAGDHVFHDDDVRIAGSLWQFGTNALAVADTNRDGNEEMFVTGSNYYGNSTQLVRNKGNPDEPAATFTPKPGKYTDSFTAADLDGDGCPELISGGGDGLYDHVYVVPGAP